MKTRQVDRSVAGFYLKKAEECRNSMMRAFESREWNACARKAELFGMPKTWKVFVHVINTIHAAISAADAFCVARLGIRSAGERHEDALVLFHGIAPENEDLKRNVKHLSELLSIKTDAEYGERLFYEKAAELAIKHAERLFDFVKGGIQKL